MLILTRKVGESMRIDDDVSVTVLGIKGNQVRLGFDAPLSVKVHREEIYLRIKAEEKARAKAEALLQKGGNTHAAARVTSN